MTTEVTQGMWEQVMGSNPSHDYGVGDDYPVYNVSWDDCQEFIDRLNEIDPSHTYRLPSEAEWEYACRAGTTSRFYWGDSDSESTMGRYCWYTENSNSSTHPVASKEPNVWGLHDMSGNVWEWCQDRYTSDYDDCPTNGSAYTSSGSNRVIRGGSWYLFASYCRSAIRLNYSPGSRYDSLGFRVARSV
jgi:formylglycine-generating enzyme required for sulfatase activity